MKAVVVITLLLLMPSAAAATAADGAAACTTAHVTVMDDFPGAAMGRCRVEDDRRLVLELSPEDEPINPSPWYAFRVEGKARSTSSSTTAITDTGIGRKGVPTARHGGSSTTIPLGPTVAR